jgi:hypothetical protein
MARIVVGSPNLTQLLLYPGLGPAMLEQHRRSLTTQFSAARIPPSLAFVGPAGTVVPEREQAASTVAARTQEGECWTIA